MKSEPIDRGHRPGIRRRSEVARSRVAAVDVGSSFVRVAVPGQVVTEEPSAVVLDGDQVVATGWAALTADRTGRRGLGVVHPVCGGAPAAPHLYTELVRQVAHRATLEGDRPGPLRVSVPVWLTAEQRADTLRCVTDAIRTSELVAVLAPVAAATGTLPSPDVEAGCLVVDVGHHLTEAAVVVGGHAVAADAGWIGGADAKAALSEHVQRIHGVQPGPRSIERALRLSPQIVFENISVRGLDLSTGASRTVRIGAYELEEVLDPVLEEISEVARRTLAAVTGRVVDGVRRHGVLLTGGMARVHGVADRLAVALDARVTISDTPGRAVVNGLRWQRRTAQGSR